MDEAKKSITKFKNINVQERREIDTSVVFKNRKLVSADVESCIYKNLTDQQGVKGRRKCVQSSVNNRPLLEKHLA